MDAEFPRKASTRSGGCAAYSVEARLSDYAEPKELCGQLITNKWKQVQFALAEHGVPDGPRWENERRQYGLLGYAASQALRWWLHAHCEASEGFGLGLSLETRIVKHNIKYEMSCTAASGHMHVHGEDRSNCIPDWGSAPASGMSAGTAETRSGSGLQPASPTAESAGE